MKRRRVGVAVLAVMAVLTASAPLSGQEAGGLRGQVVDRTTGAPVDGALVTVDGVPNASTVTDADGRWHIIRAIGGEGETRLRVRHIGYAERVLPVTGARTSIVVELAPTALPLDAVVVTASRRVQRLADVPVTIELVSRQDIEDAGVSDLSQVLFERTGVQLEGGVAAGESVMLQGLSSERVLVLIDGQPVVGRISGQFDISRIPSSMVQRIEVVKGPQSSLYGSEAMGGVVNVITRGAPGVPWQLGLNATGGSQGRADASASLAGTAGSLKYVAEGGRRSADVTPGRADESGAIADRWDGALKLGWSLSESLELEGQALLLEERQRWRSGQLYTFSDNRQTGARLGAVWSRGDSRISPTLHWSEFDHLSHRSTSTVAVEGAGERDVQSLLEAEVVYNNLFGPVAIDAGIEAKRESTIADRVTGGERVLHTVEPFAQATWGIGALDLVPGVRFSWSEQWGTHLTPRLATMFRPVPSVALRASVGRGFRAPGFKELYMEFMNIGDGFGYAVRGNPNLRAETSTNVSGGVEWSGGSTYVRAQLFHNRFDDFIETSLTGNEDGVTIYTYDNVADGMTAGAELEAGVVLAGIRAEAGYGYLRAEAGDTGERLLGRPEHSARLSVDAPITRRGPRAGITGVYTGVTPVQRTGDGVVERAGYLRMDARLSQSLPGNLELTVGARNVLDAQPEHWPGYSGRHLYLGLGWTTNGFGAQ